MKLSSITDNFLYMIHLNILTTFNFFFKLLSLNKFFITSANVNVSDELNRKRLQIIV